MTTQNKSFNSQLPPKIFNPHLGSEQDKKIPQINNAQLQDPIRLAGICSLISAIRGALQNLKIRNQKYIQHFQLNSTWRKIYNALLTFNHQQQLTTLVNLKLCEASGREKSLFDPFSKSPISICYNKINRYEKFQKQLLFNLILHYDNQVKSETNWNEIEPTVKTVIRGLNLSGLCEKDDKKCFEDEVKWRVLDKQRFQGIKINFDELYSKAVNDYEPISQVISDST